MNLFLNIVVWRPIFENANSIISSTHPDYDANIAEWEKFRSTFTGGDTFIRDYLESFSARENYVDYYKRKKITYCPAHAKSAILEIKNAIYQRMIDIIRNGGTASYQQAINGELFGVDLVGSTMNNFIGSVVLPDLLAIGKVGIYIDRDAIDDLRVNNVGKHPYLYKYDAESIKSWRYNKNILVSLLLEDTLDVTDPTTQLVIDQKTEYRLLRLIDGNVIVTIYDAKGIEQSTITLKLTVIPFVIFEISQSLLTDVANYQIALLNLASSDMNYALKANFPFYTEQYDQMAELTNLRQAITDIKTLDDTAVGNDGEVAQADKSKTKEVTVGVTQGRRYPKGLERPGFINPSAEPLRASIEKQEQLKVEIRQLVHLSLKNVTAKSISAESKEADEHGLESGLSNIGLELEFGERQIAEIWQMYEGQKSTLVIKYPTSYSLRTDDDRRKEAKEFREELSSTPSKTYQKEISKLITTITLGHKIPKETLNKIHKEIDDAELIVASAEDIIKDHEAGFVSTVTASKIRGYPAGEAEKAKIDHAERAARIVAAQVAAGKFKNPASRGVDDLDEDGENSARKEKKEGADDTLDVKTGKKQRGESR